MKGWGLDLPFPLGFWSFVCVFSSLDPSPSTYLFWRPLSQSREECVFRDEARQAPAAQGGTPKTRYERAPLLTVLRDPSGAPGLPLRT